MKIKSKIIILTCLCLSACNKDMDIVRSELETGNIWHAYIVEDEVELLYVKHKVTVLKRSIDPHKSQHVFDLGEFYSTGKLQLSDLLSNQIRMINFYKVGEYTKEIVNPFLSNEYPDSILVRDIIGRAEDCAFFKGDCEVIQRAMPRPKSMSGTYDYDSQYRFSVVKEVEIHVRDATGSIYGKPIVSIPYRLLYGEKRYKLLIFEMDEEDYLEDAKQY